MHRLPPPDLPGGYRARLTGVGEAVKPLLPARPRAGHRPCSGSGRASPRHRAIACASTRGPNGSTYRGVTAGQHPASGRRDRPHRRAADAGRLRRSLPAREHVLLLLPPRAGAHAAGRWSARRPDALGLRRPRAERPGQRAGSGSISATSDDWPGTEPAVQLIEAYAEYAHRSSPLAPAGSCWPTGSASSGFDGARDRASGRRGVEAEAYVGPGAGAGHRAAGLQPGAQPARRLPARRAASWSPAAALGWSGRRGDVRLDYQREVDRDSRNFVSERAAFSCDVPPDSSAGASPRAWTTIWPTPGSETQTPSSATPRPGSRPRAELRQYRPHFDLWTIWGASARCPTMP